MLKLKSLGKAQNWPLLYIDLIGDRSAISDGISLVWDLQKVFN